MQRIHGNGFAVQVVVPRHSAAATVSRAALKRLVPFEASDWFKVEAGSLLIGQARRGKARAFENCLVG